MAKKQEATSQAQLPMKWDEELAKYAQQFANTENSGGGNFFSLRGGQLSINDQPFPNNQAAVVVVDGIMENVFYEGDFDPENPQSPACFAFGRDESKLAPHAMTTNKQHASCAGCPRNEWGSADKGRGKACRNTRRLCLIPAGNFDDNGKFVPFKDPEQFRTVPFAYLKLPVTSVKSYAGFVRQVANVLKRPPFGVFARLKVVPNAKTQFTVNIEPLSEVPNELLPILFDRYNEASKTIDFPYQPMETDSKPVPAPKGRGRRA